MTAATLRKEFLDFFVGKGHKIIPSASLVPSTEVELTGTQKVLFTTAGMHPLIPNLLGKPHPAGKRLTSVQKSLRTDDIDQVGDSWHNTFFEMLGNWSLGDPAAPDGIGQGGYWKTEAITWSFEFLTKVLKLDPEKIYVSVFGGDKKIGGVGPDSESVAIWKSLGISKNRIFKLGAADNWWGPVSDTGPCGPDTEMFYETRKSAHGADCAPGDDCGRFAEIWNDVFMEFDRTAEGRYEPLEQKNVDTGMGVERTIAVLQGKDNVYETELFAPAMDEIKKLSKNWAVTGARIIADHLKAAVFLISDGVVPANVERGYVLRRLIRRAIRYGKQLEIKTPFTAKIADVVVDIYGDSYAELLQNKNSIAAEIAAEEERFQRVITQGLAKASKLFGEKVPITWDKYAKIMQTAAKKEIFRQIFAAKKSKKPSASLANFGLPLTWKEFNSATISGRQAFDLYQTYGFPVEAIVELAQERRLFVDIEEFEAEVETHRKLSRGAATAKFAGGLADHSKVAIAGHTATHLLHQALRDVLGNHVVQTGSNITAERIRFDFTYHEKLIPEQIDKIEGIVNSKIKAGLEVKNKVMSLEEAKRIGAIGLFGEKYGDNVSVYFIGSYSKEFCGGPHVKNTKSLGRFKIIKEESQGARKRRIYAKLESGKAKN